MACCNQATIALLLCVWQWQVCSVTGDSLNFLVLGDWGGLPTSPYRTNIEKSVANGMNNIAADKNTQFQLALGDNFYFDGVKDVKDKRFQETFEEVFTGTALQNDWYFVAGNHDWNGNISAQLAYSQVSKRWNFPYYYYLKTLTTPDGATVDIVLIDTVILCGNLVSDFDPVLTSPSGPADKPTAEKQWAWIQTTLAASKADYLLVGGHYPVFSVAEHGPTNCLLSGLRPLLFKYNVTAYLSGHDHNLQHLTENPALEPPMDYFVIGSANFAENSLKHKSSVPKNSLQFFNADTVGGFAVVSVNKTQLSLTFMSGDNKELHQKVIGPRKFN